MLVIVFSSPSELVRSSTTNRTSKIECFNRVQSWLSVLRYYPMSQVYFEPDIHAPIASDYLNLQRKGQNKTHCHKLLSLQAGSTFKMVFTSMQLNNIDYQDMGNAQCCDDLRTEDYKSQVIIDPNLQNHGESKAHSHHKPHVEEIRFEKIKREEIHPVQEQPRRVVVPEVPIQIPVLLPAVSARLGKENLNKHSQDHELHRRRYGKEIYEGHLDKNGRFPEGHGRLYKEDGSLFIGEFLRGKAEGNGVFIMPDGSIFKGKLQNNEAKGEGQYESSTLNYKGLFLHNKFHGYGKEKGINYQFQGDFYEGNRSNGKFVWRVGEAEYTFQGHFNFSNQFHGKGVLTQPEGTYDGEFKNGLKDGKGVYRYNNGLRYEGGYKQGQKDGFGKLFNYNGSAAFQGRFANDLPNGEGTTFNEKGQKSTANWVNGIDAALLS